MYVMLGAGRKNAQFPPDVLGQENPGMVAVAPRRAGEVTNGLQQGGLCSHLLARGDRCV